MNTESYNPDIEKSMHVSPLKDVREELPNMQVLECGMVVFPCGDCGDMFDSIDNLNNHKESPCRLCRTSNPIDLTASSFSPATLAVQP